MKKLLFLSLFSCFSLAAQDAVTIQLRGGYFYPASPAMRDIYHHGGAELETELGIGLSHNWNAWFNFNYFNRHGDIGGLCNATTLNMYPLSFGLKYNIPLFSRCSLYLGGGASCSLIGLQEKSPFAFYRKQQNKRWGGVAKSGFFIHLTDHLFMDIFADGYYTRASLLGEICNVGGLRTGIGLGVSF
jgi:hypothetical protein